MLAANDQRGICGCLFLNAHNKQTVWEFVHPLRELGIPAAGIVDIDLLKDGGANWAKPMKGAFVPEISHQSLSTQRAALNTAFESTGKNMKRDGGINLLPESEREACLNVFKNLSDYGVFVVPNGEVETWLSNLSNGTSKATWLATIFEAMGEDQTSPNYAVPSSGDVWEFIGSIANWVRKSDRRGVPD